MYFVLVKVMLVSHTKSQRNTLKFVIVRSHNVNDMNTFSTVNNHSHSRVKPSHKITNIEALLFVL